MSIEFLITSFIIVASPGTGALFTIAAGLTRGSRASVIAASPFLSLPGLNRQSRGHLERL